MGWIKRFQVCCYLTQKGLGRYRDGQQAKASAEAEVPGSRRAGRRLCAVRRLCGMGKANPALAADGGGDYGCFLVTCPSSCHLSVGLSVSVRFPAVSGAVGVCFGSGRAPLGQLHFWELP